MPREKWTDDRLDDGFAQVDNDLREVRQDLKDLRREMNERFDKVDERFAGIVQRRLDAMHRLFVCSVVVIIALIGLTGTLIGVNAS